MDSLPTNNTTFLHSSPGVNIPTATATATTTATVTTPIGEAPKVPKLEPLDEFLTPHNDTDEEDEMEKQLQLYSEFCRVSNLFREVFGKTLYQQFGNTDFHYDFDSHLVDVKVSVSDPILENGVSDLNFPLLSSINGDPNAGAIVPVSSPHVQGQAVEVTTTPRRNQVRMKELVRTADLGVEEEVHFREVVRKTRMLYESIRVLTSIEDEKRVTAVVEEKKRMIAAVAAGSNGEPEGSVSNVRKSYKRMRLRGDLRAASSMREQGLWLNCDKRIVGAIPGIDVGDIFLFRIELCVLGLHGQIQAGIDYLPGSMSSNGEPIATSVIVSGGYEDDLDDGEVVVYTGQGGQEKNSYKQVSDQKLEGGNLALERSMRYGIEIRVIRGLRYEGSASSSGKVYVYDGLYKIVDCWFDVGRSGFGVYKYKLQRIEGQEKMGSAILKEARDIRRSGIDFHPMHCLSVDISNGQENFPVRLFNDIDDNHDPICFEYITKTTFPQFVFHQSGKATGCDCIDGCAHDCFCFMKNGSEFPYNRHGILIRGKPLIFECGPFCRCPPHCRNRVTQKGLKNRLEVFRSTETEWGVRSLDFIHAGAFICEYAGVVLTREQAQILTMNGCDSPINPNHFSQRWAEWGDVSQVYSDFVRHPSYPSVPPLDFYLDVSTVRNVACYISHSSTPNVFVQFVLYDHNNLMFPHIMVFAMENIPPMRELSLDYGVADE